MGAQARAIGERLRKQIESIFKALTLEIDKEMRRDPSQGGTPVDTGHARANWVPSVGTPHVGEVDSVRVANTIGSSEHAAGVAQVLRFKLGDGALWVSNSVPYIEILNYGWSDQAPPLFIEAAVDRAVATISARYSVRIDVDRPTGAENLAAAYSPFGDD